ncbi:hypothetical protein DIPPA_00066 [Diplonema papillatum]|nr:hypothetical protein DIPPA_00066 [Diplonema papillatum]
MSGRSRGYRDRDSNYSARDRTSSASDSRGGGRLPPDHEVLRVHKELRGRDTRDQRDDVIARLMDKVNENSELFASLEARLADRDAEIESLTCELERMEDELAVAQRVGARRERLALREEEMTLEEEIRERDRRVDDLLCELDEKEKTSDLLGKMVQEKEQNIALLKEHHDAELSRQGARFNEVLDSRDDEIEALAAQVRGLEDKVAVLEQENYALTDDARDLVTKREREIDGLEDVLEEAHAELKHTKVSTVHLVDDVCDIFSIPPADSEEQLLSALKHIRTFMDEAAEDATRLQSDYTTALEDVNNLSAQADADATKIDELTEQSKTAEETVHALEAKVTELEAKVAELESQKKEAEERLGEKDKEFERVHDAAEEDRDTLRRREEEIELLKKEQDLLEEEKRLEVELGDEMRRGVQRRLSGELSPPRQSPAPGSDAPANLRTRRTDASNSDSASEADVLNTDVLVTDQDVSAQLDGLQCTLDGILEAVSGRPASPAPCPRSAPMSDKLAVVSQAVDDLLDENAALRQSRNRSRRQKEEMNSVLIDDPFVEELAWSDDGVDDDDLSDDPSGNHRWAVSRVRVRSLLDKAQKLRRDVGRLQRKQRQLEEENSLSRGDGLRSVPPPQAPAGPPADEQSAVSAEEEGYSVGPYLGLVTEVNRSVTDVGPGVRILDVRASTAAERAGLRVGDRVLEIGKRKVACSADLEEVLASIAPGDTVDVVYLRKDNRKATLLVVDPAAETKRRKRRMGRQEILARVDSSRLYDASKPSRTKAKRR